MKTQRLIEVSCLALDDSCSIVLYYDVLELTGTIFVPVLLYYVNTCCKHVNELFFELLSHPVSGEKRCKITAVFDTDQIFLELFSIKVINNFGKISLII